MVLLQKDDKPTVVAKSEKEQTKGGENNSEARDAATISQGGQRDGTISPSSRSRASIGDSAERRYEESAFKERLSMGFSLQHREIFLCHPSLLILASTCSIAVIRERWKESVIR